MRLSCTVFKISYSEFFVETRKFFLLHVRLPSPPVGWPQSNFTEIFGIRKLESRAVGVVCVILHLAVLVELRLVTDGPDGQRDIRTDGHTIYSASMASHSTNTHTHLLHFAWVVDDAKCILVTRVCVSVARRTPTLLHGPGCILGMVGGALYSYVLLAGFAIGARVSLLWYHSPNAKCQRLSECLYSLYAWFKTLPEGQ